MPCRCFLSEGGRRAGKVGHPGNWSYQDHTDSMQGLTFSRLSSPSHQSSKRLRGTEFPAGVNPLQSFLMLPRGAPALPCDSLSSSCSPRAPCWGKEYQVVERNTAHQQLKHHTPLIFMDCELLNYADENM